MTKLAYHFITETDLSPEDDQRIRNLLMLAFPDYADLFTLASYYYSRPDYRLWMETEDNQMIGHLDFEPRLIGVKDQEFMIAGVGEVSIHPDYHGQGYGRQLMDRLKAILKDDFPAIDFGFLQCRPAVVGYYERVGWHRLNQSVREQNVNSGDIVETTVPALILPVHKSMTEWQSEGVVDVRGVPW